MRKLFNKALVYLITFYIIVSPVTPAVQVLQAKAQKLEIETGSEIDVTPEKITVTDTASTLPVDPSTFVPSELEEPGRHTIEVCFVNLDEKGQVLDNLPRAVEFEFPIFTNPNINRNTGLPDAYVESGSELNDTNTIKVNMDEETGNNETIWNNSGKNDAYCEKIEIETDPETERKAYAYGEMTITDPLNDWFDTRYHDGYQEEFIHPKYAEKYSPELFELDEDGNHIPNPDKHHGGDHKNRDNLSDGHINMYGPDDERRIVIVNKIEKRVLPKTIEVCFVNIDSEGNFIDGNYLGNGTSFEIDLYADLIEGENGLPEENRSRVYETVKLRTPFSNNADIFNTREQTGFCKEVEFVTKNKSIGYSTVSINSNHSIQTPLYSDQHTGFLNGINDFHNYSNELFDGIEGNENDRNKDSDGHIVIPENGNPRRLVILNSLNANSFIGEINVVDKYGEDIDGHLHDFYDENVEYLNEESNNSTKYITYKIKDNDPNEIKHVRFSWDGFNWDTLSSLPYETNCNQSNLDNAVEVTSCNAWNGEEFQEWLFPFEEERKETRFMEITDSAGNVRIITKDIVFDMTPPDNKIIFVQGERRYDSSNPTTLFDTENDKESWLTYHIKDGRNSLKTPGKKLSDSEVSGAYKIRFMQDGVDNNEWTNWQDYTNDKIETRLLAWNELINRECDDEDKNCSENLFVSGQTMDRAGNVSGIFSDKMDYYRPREDKLDTFLDISAVTSNLDKAFFEFDLRVDSDQSWTFDLVDTNIPVPDITEISLDDTNTIASLSGVAFTKEYDIQVNVTETVKTNPWCVAFCSYEDRVYTINEEHSFTDHWMRYYKFDFTSNEENDHQVGDKYIYNDGTFDADIWIHPDNNLTLGNMVYGKATLEGWFELELENYGIKPFYDFTGDNRFFSERSNLAVLSSTQDNQFIEDVEGSDNKDDAPVKLHSLDLEGMDDIAPGNIFYDYIKNLIEDGIVNGYSTGKFEPDNFVTRAEMSKFIIKGLDLEGKECDKQHSFSDVSEGNVFAPYINKMACLGISTGYSDGTYKPDKDIERGEATKLLVNGLNAKHGMDIISEYPLPDDISEYYNDVTSNNVFAEYIGVLSILRVNGESIVKGYSGSTPPPFKPGNQISRGQMAKIIDLARQWSNPVLAIESGYKSELNYRLKKHSEYYLQFKLITSKYSLGEVKGDVARLEFIEEGFEIKRLWELEKLEREQEILTEELISITDEFISSSDVAIIGSEYALGLRPVWEWAIVGEKIMISAVNNPGDFSKGFATGLYRCIPDTIYAILHIAQVIDFFIYVLEDPSILADLNELALYEASRLSEAASANIGGRMLGETICGVLVDKGLSKLAQLKAVDDINNIVRNRFLDRAIAKKLFYRILTDTKAKYPSIANRLDHVVLGDVGNITSGLHHGQTLVRYLEDGLIKIRYYDSGIEITTAAELIDAIDNGTKLQYYNIIKKEWLKAPKSVFPMSWDVEKVAYAGDFSLNNPHLYNNVVYRPGTTDLDKADIVIDGVTVRLYFDRTGTKLSTWFPVY